MVSWLNTQNNQCDQEENEVSEELTPEEKEYAKQYELDAIEDAKTDEHS